RRPSALLAPKPRTIDRAKRDWWVTLPTRRVAGRILQPPGEPSRHTPIRGVLMRRLFKSWTFGFALGLALVSGATAGVIVGPVAHRGTGLRQPSAAVPKAPVARGPRVGAAALHTDPDQVPALVDQKVTLSL